MITIKDIESIVTNTVKAKVDTFLIDIYVVDIKNQILVIEYYLLHEKSMPITIIYKENDIMQLTMIDQMYFKIAFLHYLPIIKNKK